MHTENSLLGCFVSATLNWDDDPQTMEVAAEKGELFDTYIWGTDGISEPLKTLNRQDYGTDLALILFQFYVNPIPWELANLREIESYRKKEKSIGIPIIVNDDNFFSKPETERRRFLRESILEKLRLLEGVVKKEETRYEHDQAQNRCGEDSAPALTRQRVGQSGRCVLGGGQGPLRAEPLTR